MILLKLIQSLSIYMTCLVRPGVSRVLSKGKVSLPLKKINYIELQGSDPGKIM